MKLKFKLKLFNKKKKEIFVLTGLVLLVLGHCFFSSNFTVVTFLSTSYTALELMFCRFIVAPIMLMPRVIKQPFRWDKCHFLVLRTLFGFGAMSCLFLSFRSQQPGQMTLLFMLSIVWAFVAARFLLKEIPKLGTLVCVILAFVGIFLIIRPDLTVMDNYSLMAILASVFNAGVILSLKKCREYYDSTTIVCFFACSSLLLLAPFLTSRFFVTETWLWIGVVGILSTSGQLLFTQGYKYCSAGIAGAIGLISVPLMYISGHVFFNDQLTLLGVVGVSCVFSALAIMYYIEYITPKY